MGKLTKKKLLRLITPHFIANDYTLFYGKNGIFSSLFVKRKEDLFLSVCMNIHRFYDDQFTADLYLSTMTRFACTWGDIPKRCYTRPGWYLTEEELSKYLRDGNVFPDIWWDSSPESIEAFISILKIAEKRMFEDHELIENIHKSKELVQLTNNTFSVIKAVEAHNQKENRLSLSNTGNVHLKPPECWYEEAELFWRNKKDNYSQMAIVDLAQDAYRMYVLTNQG